jgi:anti-sigma regulatory factor (Ser/Thr protein kinase)/tetratricopeptide (TPR) repeat protein
MMIRFLFFGFFIFHFWIYQSVYFAQKTSEDIVRTDKIKTWNDLNLVYKNQNLIKQQEILDKLKNEKSKVVLKSELKLIELNLHEELISQKNLVDFEKQFKNSYEELTFDDVLSNARFQSLRVQYAYFFQRGDYLKIARDFLSNAKKSRKNQIISQAYIEMSWAFAYENSTDSSFICGELATEFAQRSDSKTKFALSLRNQAKLRQYFGLNNDCVVKYIEFLQVANELQNDLLVSLANMDLGFVLLDSENFGGATNYFQRAKQIGENRLDYYHTSLLNYGQILCDLNEGNLKSAKQIFQKIKSSSKYSKSEELQGLLSFAQAEIVASEMKWSEAIEFYKKSIIHFEKLKDSQKLGFCHQQIAKCLINLKKFREAELAVLQSVKNNLRLIEFKSNENYKLLAVIYESTNRQAEAFKNQKVYLENLQKSSISKDVVAINELAESNLREEREKLIQSQNASIERERSEKEKLEAQRTRNLLVSIIGALVLILGLIILFLRTKQIRSQQEQKDAEMSQALLRTQMNPHFVFNAMSVIQSYIFTHSPEKSSKFLVNFSKLMRLILENSPKEFIPLELEEEILEKYLNTQKLRFEDRFEFELDIDSDLIFQKAMVPPMITQPFVENAIEHGQLHTVENGTIFISAKQKDNMLEIIVCDNGIGRKSSAKTKKIKTHKSMAINMTSERIEILNRKYRSTGNMSIEDFDPETGRGTKVTILLPLKFEQ